MFKRGSSHDLDWEAIGEMASNGIPIETADTDCHDGGGRKPMHIMMTADIAQQPPSSRFNAVDDAIRKKEKECFDPFLVPSAPEAYYRWQLSHTAGGRRREFHQFLYTLLSMMISW